MTGLLQILAEQSVALATLLFLLWLGSRSLPLILYWSLEWRRMSIIQAYLSASENRPAQVDLHKLLGPIQPPQASRSMLPRLSSRRRKEPT